MNIRGIFKKSGHVHYRLPVLGRITKSAREYVEQMTADGVNPNTPDADGTLPTWPIIISQEEQL